MPITEETDVPVLIAGAGPAGLTAAITLARYGIAIRAGSIGPVSASTNTATAANARRPPPDRRNGATTPASCPTAGPTDRRCVDARTRLPSTPTPSRSPSPRRPAAAAPPAATARGSPHSLRSGIGAGAAEWALQHHAAAPSRLSVESTFVHEMSTRHDRLSVWAAEGAGQPRARTPTAVH